MSSLVIARIAFRRHHHGERGVVVPAQIEILQLPVARRQQRRQKIRHQPQHQHLAFRIAEADIVFDQLRAIFGDHQSGEQHAFVGRAHRLHGAHGRHDDLVHHALVHFRRHDRRRRIGAHAAGIGTLVAVADALVVLRGGQARSRSRRRTGRRTRPPRRRGSPRSRSPRPAAPRPAAEHHVDGGFRLGTVSARRRPCRRPARRPSPRSARLLRT